MYFDFDITTSQGVIDDTAYDFVHGHVILLIDDANHHDSGLLVVVQV
jgi:hypothetical protein